MTAKQLQTTLDAFNQRAFGQLSHRLQIALSSSNGSFTLPGVRFASSIPPDNVAGLFSHGRNHLPAILQRPNVNSPEYWAVGAVLDAGLAAPSECSAVRIAVGINYWQFNSQPFSPSGWSDTKMRPRLDSAVSACWPSANGGSAYHLVAMNFFPWVTDRPWSKIGNALVEAFALERWGWSDPSAVVADLINSILAAEVDVLVAFHGVNCVVPCSGVETRKKLCRPAPCVWTDNLAPPGKKVKTAATFL